VKIKGDEEAREIRGFYSRTHTSVLVEHYAMRHHWIRGEKDHHGKSGACVVIVYVNDGREK
jgi:hypothetical protein